MAVSNEEINAWLQANAGASDATIAQAMNQYGVSTEQMAQATGLGQEAVQSRYDAASAPLYQGLTATSTPDQIAQAYSQFASGAGGDNQSAQTQAVDYLTKLGVSAPTITQAYNQYLQPEAAPNAYFQQNPDVAAAFQQDSYGLTPDQFAATHFQNYGAAEQRAAPTSGALAQPFQDQEVDPYVYAYEYGVANDDFSGLLGLLKQTPDSTQLISKYSLTPEQINQIEFGTGFDLDQSGGYGAGKVGNDWDYGAYLDKLRAGDADSLSEAASMFATFDPLRANSVQNMFDELLKQQTVTGNNWSAGNLGSKEAAAMDFALRLAENNVDSIYDLGQRTVDVERFDSEMGGNYTTQETEYYNKKTGEALPDWARVASGNNSGSKLNYRINFADDGTPIPYTTRKQSDWMEFREGFLKPAISIIAMANPALAPYVAAGNALNAASKGDWGSAVVSALAATSGFSGDLGLSASTVDSLKTAKTAAQVLNAIDKGNPLAIVNALAQTDTGKELLASDMGGGVTLNQVLDTARVAASVNAGDYASALNYAGSLTNSPDLKVAGSSAALVNAVKSGDPFKIATAMGQLDRAVKTATKDGGGITNRVVDEAIPQGEVTQQLVDAGLEEDVNLPTGIQTASADGETPFRVEAAGAPIFADSPQAGSVRPPPGYRLMATTEEQEIQAGDRTKYVKPAGSYYDYTANAWFTPTGEFDAALDVKDYSALFGGDQANLTDADIAAIQGEGLGVGSNASELGLDWDSMYQPSGLASSGGSDLGEMVITAPREPVSDMGEMVITAPRDVPTDLGEMVITAPREPVLPDDDFPTEETEYPEMVVTAPREPVTPSTPAKPSTPEQPVVAPATPAAPTTPTQVAEAKKQIALTLNLPASSPVVQDIFEALYGTMEYLDVSEEFEPSKRKARPAATQKQLQQTKMAQGGYLDDLLAENMSVDELLNLLR